tara:strand:- start:2542 stop:2826 length:285 start_codon:yes stop_codon:yes gene_type:complete
MINTLDQQNFLEQVRQHSRWKQFSYEGWQLIYDWETELNSKVEYDPVAFCCEYAEYDSLDKLKDDYNDIESKDDLESKTWVGYLPEGRILIRQF